MSKKYNPIKKYVLKNGQTRYKFQVYLGVDPLTGEPKQTTRTFNSQREAITARARIKFEVANGTYKQQKIDTYQDVYNLWLEQYEKTVEESTLVKTIGIFKNHILPAMSSYRLDKINVDVCQKHLNNWATQLKNFLKVKAYASKVLDFAIKRDYIRVNPFSLTDNPTYQKRKNLHEEDVVENFYTRKNLTKFLKCVEKEDNYKAYAFFRLLSFSGMRKGEALALTWKDVNFTTNEIRITKAISKGLKNKLYVKPTKTGTSRTIKMDDKTMEVLKTWKRIQKQDYLTLGFNTMQPKQLIFSNKQNEYLQPTMTRKWIKQIQKKYNLEAITTHGLRHTHCSLLFEAGVSLKEVQVRLGHSDVKTTLDIYTHVTQEAKDEAILKFASHVDM